MDQLPATVGNSPTFVATISQAAGGTLGVRVIECMRHMLTLLLIILGWVIRCTVTETTHARSHRRLKKIILSSSPMAHAARLAQSFRSSSKHRQAFSPSLLVDAASKSIRMKSNRITASSTLTVARYCPMQSVGGSKGNNNQYLTDLGNIVRQAYEQASPDQQALLKPYAKQGPEVLEEDIEQMLARNYIESHPGVNFQNNLRKEDDSATPLHFVYEAANCESSNALLVACTC
jgi:hypothetical protein